MRSAIFDGNYLLHRCCRVGGLASLRDRQDRPTGGIQGFLKSIHAFLLSFEIDSCTVVFDAGISKRRRSIFPEYKGNKYRDKSDPLHSEPDDEKKAYLDDFRKQMYCIQHLLKLIGIPVVKVKGWEADDLVYRIATEHSAPGLVTVISDDRDYLQIVEENIQVYRPIASEIITESNFSDAVGHEKHQTLLRKSIVGDGSDKIPGILGVGNKTLDKLFLEGAPVGEYPFEDFILYCMNHKSKKVRAISDCMDVVVRNYELMCLDMEEYPRELKKDVNRILSNKPGLQLVKLQHFLNELDLFQISDQLHTWVLPFQRLR